MGCWVEPTAGDRLFPGEEIKTLGAICLGVTEEGVLPTTEGVVRNRHWDWHVDADHAHFDLMLEAACCSTIVGEDCGSVAEFTGVDQLNCLVEGCDTNDREDRAEDFFGVGTGREGDVVDKRRAEEEALLVPVYGAVTPVHDDLGAVGLSDVDIRSDLVAVDVGD